MRGVPKMSLGIIIVIAAACVFYGGAVSDIATFMNLAETGAPPSMRHFFGTDALGRDIFKMICAGGRVSLFIGFFATAISTFISILYGCVSAISKAWIDDALMRLAEIFISVPQILLVLFLQAALGGPSVISISVVIGLTGWMAIAKMVRGEVKHIRNAEFVLSAKLSGGGFFYITRWHYAPIFFHAIMFMVVSNIGAAIALEATLGFLGLGLPVNDASWGGLLALSQNAMLSGAWWVLVIPGAVLVVTLVCVTNIGEYLRQINSREKLV